MKVRALWFFPTGTVAGTVRALCGHCTGTVFWQHFRGRRQHCAEAMPSARRGGANYADACPRAPWGRARSSEAQRVIAGSLHLEPSTPTKSTPKAILVKQLSDRPCSFYGNSSSLTYPRPPSFHARERQREVTACGTEHFDGRWKVNSNQRTSWVSIYSWHMASGHPKNLSPVEFSAAVLLLTAVHRGHLIGFDCSIIIINYLLIL